MQFKIVRYRDQQGVYHEGNTVHCLRRTVEVSERHPRGKNVQKIVAKFDRWARELPPDVSAALTPAERAEWQQWRVKHDTEHQKTIARFELDSLPERLEKAAAALQLCDGEPIDAAAIWAGIDALSKAMTRAGFERPKRPRGRPSTSSAEDEWDIRSLPNFFQPGTDEHRAYQKLLDAYKRAKS